MPAPMPLEPPVTRATLPLNDFACICHQNPLSHLLCPFWIILSRMAVQRDRPTASYPTSRRNGPVERATAVCQKGCKRTWGERSVIFHYFPSNELSNFWINAAVPAS